MATTVHLQRPRGSEIMTKKSWLSTHPHIKNFAYVIIVLFTIITLVFTFGRGTVKNWIDDIAQSQGYKLTPMIDDTE